jgi:dephospho-CoA kinase
MRLVGLTGGTGTGKSTVAATWRAHGLPVIDCDALARAAVEPGRWGHARLVRALGRGVLKPDGSVDREAVGRLVFSDAAARRRLNAATHPPVALALVRALLAAWLSCALVVAIDMPLLFESGAWRWTGARVLVEAPAETQAARVVARDGLAPADAAARVAAQAPAEGKRRHCGVVIDHAGGLAEWEAKAEAARAAVTRGLWWHALLTPPGVAALAAACVAAAVLA